MAKPVDCESPVDGMVCGECAACREASEHEAALLKEILDSRAPSVSIIGELLTALENLHDACEHWEDQGDPVLKAARAAIERAKGTASREFTVWVVWGSDETLAENHVEPSLYSFWSQAELDAFMLALQEIDGNCDLHETFDSEDEANEKCNIRSE